MGGRDHGRFRQPKGPIRFNGKYSRVDKERRMFTASCTIVPSDANMYIPPWTIGLIQERLDVLQLAIQNLLKSEDGRCVSLDCVEKDGFATIKPAIVAIVKVCMAYIKGHDFKVGAWLSDQAKWYNKSLA